MNSFSLWFETDTSIVLEKTDTIISGASGDTTIPNKDAFTISNILNLKTRITPNEMIDILHNEYNINYPNIKLWNYDIDYSLGNNFEKLVCTILFINGVYGIHYICNTDHYTINQQKQYILENVIPKYKLYSQTDNEYVLLINTFTNGGRSKTSIYENIFLEKR